MCGALYIASFEHQDGILWKYKTRSIYTVKYPGTDNFLLDICNKHDEQEYLYAADGAAFKNCRYIGWW